MTLTLTPRAVAASVDELLAGATERRPWKTADSLSGSRFERVVIDGEPYVVKWLHCDDDWIQRCTGDLTCRPLLMWRSGLFDALPATIDHTIVAMADGDGRNGLGAVVLMRDVSGGIVPEGSSTIPLDQHLRFLDHMAEMHATFWGWEDTVELMPMGNRYLELNPLVAEIEAGLGGTDPVPRMLVDGWAAFAREAPQAADTVLPLLQDPWPLVDALAATPSTFVHGDWKLGNLGRHTDGRTIVLDFAVPGEGPACLDLAWYLAVNCDRLPHAKEDAIAAYRSSLEARGVDTAGWWDAQLGLALVGGLVQLGWSKTGPELAWWQDRVVEHAHLLA